MNHADSGSLIAWLDGELPARERAALDVHLSRCSSCAADLAELRAMARETSVALALADSSIPMLVTRTRIEDIAPRPRLRRPVVFFPARSAGGILKAAAVMLLLAGAASAAIPGSPGRRLIGRVAELTSRIVRGQQPEVPAPAPAPLPAVVQEPVAPPTDFTIGAAEGRMRIALYDVANGARVTVRLIDGDSAHVSPLSSQDPANTTRGAGKLELYGITAGIVIELPRNVPTIRVEVDGTLWFVKDGDTHQVLGPATETGRDEFVFQTRH